MTSLAPIRAAVVCAVFTPFHIRRYQVTRSLGLERGSELLAIQTARRQSDYRWHRADFSEEWTATLCMDDDFWSVSYRRVRKELSRVLDAFRPDVVVLPGWRTNDALAGLGWALRTGTARVLISDSQPIDNPQYFPKPQIKKLLARRFHAALTAGSPHVRYMRQLGIPADAIFTGSAVVDNEFFSRVPRERHSRSLRLLSCIRLLKRKNVPMVLDVLASNREWTWWIAGDGPDRGFIESRIAERGVGDRVRLLGHVPYDDLPALHGQADVYLQPSLSEPWALAVNEAMAAGLPVLVSTACGCHEDLVREGVNGYTFDPTRPDALEHVLNRIAAEADLLPQMGEASGRIVADWDLGHYAANFWRACDAAVRGQKQTRRNVLADLALRVAL